jgi:hypothetical protein
MKLAHIVFASLLLTTAAYGLGSRRTSTSEAREAAEAAMAAAGAAAIAEELKGVKVTLADGLKAAEQSGKPISGRYWILHGKFQLSVYTTKDGKFTEVIIDYKTGKVAKTEAITDGDDLEDAQELAAAMAKAKRTLAEVIAEAENANPGFKAVSIEPKIEDSEVHADIALLKGEESKHSENVL